MSFFKQPLSAARLAANRANARKSTGPRSVTGKSVSAGNSLKHGLTAATALLPSEDRAAYDQYVEGIVASLHPGNLLEYEICRDVADAHWRLRRIHSAETKLLAPPEQVHSDDAPLPIPSREDDLFFAARICLNHPTALPNIALYEQRIQRGIKNSMDELRRLRSEREALAERDMPEALKHYKHQILQGKGDDYKPAEHGFVFSFDEVDAAFDLELLQKRVDLAEKINYDLGEYRKQFPPKAA